jgi:hypothetical protein
VPLKEKQFNDQDDQGNEEHEDGNAVDAMHIPDPLRVWSIGIFLPDV